MRDFVRGQTQILYRYLPGSIFDHDDYGPSLVSEVDLDSAVEINRHALFNALEDILCQWPMEFREEFPDPANERLQSRYVIGVPTRVRFNPFPGNFKCKNPHCNYTTTLDGLRKKRGQPGICPRCNGSLGRLRLVQIHNCGRVADVYIPANEPAHRGHDLGFYDPGRVTRATWYCLNCRTEVRQMRMSPCNCTFTESLKSSNSNIPGKSNRSGQYMRVTPIGEPSVFIPQVSVFVNFHQDTERALATAPNANGLLLARLWGILQKPVDVVLGDISKSTSSTSGDRNKQLVDELRKHDPKHPLVIEFDEQQKNPPGQFELNQVINLTTKEILLEPPKSRLVEHIALLDKTHLTRIEDVVNHHRKNGSEEEAEKYGELAKKAFGNLGLQDVLVTNEFPISLTAFGYTRVSREPSKSVIRPFQSIRNQVPIYVVPTLTEGLWFQLDPLRVAQWLSTNEFAAGQVPKTRVEAWAWLHSRVLNRNFRRRTEDDNLTSNALETLIHTISHVLLQRIEWSGFKASSIGEYLMPETLSFILYANRYAESKIGGLITLFEQRLHLWLEDAAQAGRNCIYDPLCADDGGSCFGCLHREHNCSLFNYKLSRSILYGGSVNDPGKQRDFVVKEGYWNS